MIVSKVRHLNSFGRLVYWINERETVRCRKTVREVRPWTDDEILKQYRFTNVRRMDDYVSMWLLKNWYEPYQGHPNMVYAIALARFFNQPSTLDQITAIAFGDKWNPKALKKVIRKRRDNGNTIFRAAYMVRGNDGQDKIESVIDHNVSELIKNEVAKRIDPTSMQRTWEVIQDVHGFGSFMAGQCVADARHTIEGTWDDKLGWAPMGPGSRRGMNRLHERWLKYSLSQDQFLEELQDLFSQLIDALPLEIVGRLEAMDVQNCCCEYDKYCRALFGEGRPKQVYVPHEEVM